jgi:hypothetical protein
LPCQQPIGKTTNSRCTDSLGSESLFSPVREAPQATLSLTTGVLGGWRKAPDPSGPQRGAIEARERSEWTARDMRVLSVHLRKPDMLEEPMLGKRYVSLSALSGIFCRVGDNVLPPPEVLQLPILRHLRIQLSMISSTVQQRIRRAHGERRAARHDSLSRFAHRVVGVSLEE